MDKFKILTAVVIFCVLSLVLWFFIGSWGIFLGGLAALAYIYFTDKQDMEITEADFMQMYYHISEDRLDWWKFPYPDDLGRMDFKEVRAFGDPLGSFWCLAYEDRETNEIIGGIFTKDSKVISKFKTEGMTPSQAIEMFMERRRRPTMIGYPPNGYGATKKPSDLEKIDQELHGA